MKKKKKRNTSYILWCLGLVIIDLSLLPITVSQKDTYQKIVCKETKEIAYKEQTEIMYEENLTEEQILKIQQQKREGRLNIKSSILTPEDEENIFRLGKIVAAEGGGVDGEWGKSQSEKAGITSDLWQQYIAYVVLNRVYQKGYPDTIEGVFYQEGQYAPISIEKYEKDFYTENSLKNARVAYLNYLYNEMPVPKNMVFQSEFEQGNVLLHVGNTYFGTAPLLPAE